MDSTSQWPSYGPSDSEIDKLVMLSRYLGARSDFVLAGGGNTSVKIGDRLFIKASGSALADMTAGDLVEMDRRELADLLGREFSHDPRLREEQCKGYVLAARANPGKNQRPSVECVLHNILWSTFVVHTHPTLVNMLTCCTGGEGLARKMLAGVDFIWVPYTDPGIVLAQTLLEAVKDYSQRTGKACPAAVLIQNHGLIVCGDTPEDIRIHTEAILDPIRRKLEGASPSFGPTVMLAPAAARELVNVLGPALRALTANGESLKVVTFDDSAVAAALAGAKDGAQVAGGGPLTPDQIVYCRSVPLWFDAEEKPEPARVVERLREAVNEYRSAHGYGPQVVLAAGVGMFGVGDDFRKARTACLVYADAIAVMAGARRLGGIRYLNKTQRDFIDQWEVESYRRAVAGGCGPAGRAAGKVVVVTGAAQGFGLEIAKDFAAQGAHVVLADLNVAGAVGAAGDICHELDKEVAIGLSVNVADPASIEEAFHKVVRAYGGFDVLVSNAGVLQAGSVKTQTPKEFGLVTAVNYTGYFLCVQKACPIMAVQRLGKVDWWGDIIQINSKSGLEGSNRNGAYAGSKFGGIGLTQSFALELIADGIKVNAVCPGNFFEGPLWSDPRTGLFVQYLRSGKVPGAKTVADVRRFYESKVPMGRGCQAADVMKAIYYIIDQKYETGQAVPVTGGQVMLH